MAVNCPGSISPGNGRECVSLLITHTIAPHEVFCIRAVFPKGNLGQHRTVFLGQCHSYLVLDETISYPVCAENCVFEATMDR